LGLFPIKNPLQNHSTSVDFNRPNFIFHSPNGNLDGPNLSFASIDRYWDRIRCPISLYKACLPAGRELLK